MSLPAPGPTDEPLITALVAERCPACGARLAPAAEWCGLCFADLRPAPAPASSPGATPQPVAEALPSPREAVPQPEAGPAISVPGTIARPMWPCSGCAAMVDVDLDACPACGTGFLGALRSPTSGIELPVVGDLGRLSDKARIVIGAGAGLVIALVMVLLLALLGH